MARFEPEQEDRELLRMIQQCVNEARLAAYANVRGYRNLLVISIFVLVVLLLGFPYALRQLDLNFISLSGQASTAPTGGQLGAISVATRQPVSSRQIITLEVWGAFGGLVGALIALRRIGGLSGPYGLRAAQIALKLPAGALLALFGLLLVQSQIIAPLAAIEDSKLAAYAALFGFTQESVTRLVDRQAGQLLGEARSTNDPEKPVTMERSGSAT